MQHQPPKLPHVVEQDTTGGSETGAVGIGRTGIGEHVHAGGPRRLHAGNGVLDHHAIEGLHVHL